MVVSVQVIAIIASPLWEASRKTGVDSGCLNIPTKHSLQPKNESHPRNALTLPWALVSHAFPLTHFLRGWANQKPSFRLPLRQQKNAPWRGRFPVSPGCGHVFAAAGPQFGGLHGVSVCVWCVFGQVACVFLLCTPAMGTQGPQLCGKLVILCGPWLLLF